MARELLTNEQPSALQRSGRTYTCAYVHVAAHMQKNDGGTVYTCILYTLQYRKGYILQNYTVLHFLVYLSAIIIVLQVDTSCHVAGLCSTVEAVFNNLLLVSQARLSCKTAF